MRNALLLATALAPLLAAQADAGHPFRDAPHVAASAIAPPAAIGQVHQTVSEDQPGFDRLLLPVPRHGSHRVTRHGSTWVVARPRGDRLLDATQLPDVGPLPRSVVSIVAGTTKTGAPTTEVTVLPGVQVHYSFGDAVVRLDIAAPSGAPALVVPPTSAHAVALAAPVAAKPLKMPTGRDRPPATVAALPAPAVRDAAMPATPTPAAPIPAAPALAASVPGAVAIERAAGGVGPGILLRTGADVGLAAFRVGGEMLVVLDAAIEFQAPGASLDPAFAGMSSRRTQDATVIRIPLAAPGAIRLSRGAGGWLVTLAAPPDGIAGIVPQLVEGGPGVASNAARMRLPASAPSRVVTVVDPRTGDRLLVGTQATPGEAVQGERLDVQFDLLATLQGVAVLPLSDDIRLLREAPGFVLVAGPHAGGNIISGIDPQDPATAPAAPLSRLFDIPGDTTPVLLRKLVEQVDAAAAAPALARSAPRLRLAATMVALGMGVEAQSVLDVAAAEDPELGSTPRLVGLRAAASLLAHRFDEADKFADPRLTGTVEIALWRSLLQVAREQATERDAASLAAGVPLLMAYPPTLRERLLPEALEAMALRGQAAAAQATLQKLPDRRELDLARGMAFEMTGHPADALQVYDRAAAGADRLPRYKALVRAVELRLLGGKLDAKAAADTMDQALFGWRGAQQELPLRIRIAQLRRQTGQWRDAITVLRDGRAAFPDDRAQIDAEIAVTLTALLSGDAARRLPPSEFVALYDQNQDLMQSMPWAEPLAIRLVDHLVELRLLGRAEPIMARLVARTAEPASRAALGTRLAALRMAMDDPGGAIAALAATAAAAVVAPATAPARQLLYARAESARGNKDLALSMLGSLGTAEADEARADIYAARHDWPQVVAALGALERKRIPATDGRAADSLTVPQQATVMRLAEAATLGADGATLARVAATYGPAMEKGDSAALFRLVTSAPVRGTKDLPRAFAEIKLARQLRAGQGLTGLSPTSLDSTSLNPSQKP